MKRERSCNIVDCTWTELQCLKYRYTLYKICIDFILIVTYHEKISNYIYESIQFHPDCKNSVQQFL